MALCEKDGTSKEVMNNFKVKGGFTAGYVMIKDVQINYQYNSVNLLIGKYASEEARQDNIDCCESESVGFPVTEQALKAITTADDRAVFYPYLEAQIQYLALAGLADENHEDTVQAIYDEYCIENPYKSKEGGE